MNTRFFTAFLLLLILAACAAPAPATAPQPIPATNTPAAALTLDQVLDSTYALKGFDGSPQTFTLVNGAYVSGNDPASSTSVGITRDMVALGDINGDGLSDAVVPIFLNFGGSGSFVNLAAVLNQAGKPVHAAPATYGIGDRTVIQSLTVENGLVKLRALISGPNDPLCCPSVPLSTTFEYSDMGFRLLHLTTTTSSGLVREISVTVPAVEATVGPQTVITGTTTVGPFENTLVYRIYDTTGMAITESSLMVENDELGAPSTFNLPLDFSTLGISGRIRVEIAEMSMADGSTLMMDSIYLNVGN